MTDKNVKRLLVTGGSGYLGQHLTRRAAETFELYTTYHHHPGDIRAGQPVALNLTNQEAVHQLIAELRPQAVIHTAAINPGGGSDEVMLATNIEGTRYVAEAAVAVGARLVHVSTDVLHD